MKPINFRSKQPKQRRHPVQQIKKILAILKVHVPTYMPASLFPLFSHGAPTQCQVTLPLRPLVENLSAAAAVPDPNPQLAAQNRAREHAKCGEGESRRDRVKPTGDKDDRVEDKNGNNNNNNNAGVGMNEKSKRSASDDDRQGQLLRAEISGNFPATGRGGGRAGGLSRGPRDAALSLSLTLAVSVPVKQVRVRGGVRVAGVLVGSGRRVWGGGGRDTCARYGALHRGRNK